MLFIVSDVELSPAGADDTSDDIRIGIERTSGAKCERCWRYVARVSSEPAWAGLCDRCQGVLAEPVPQS
jgi:isoleucyl-tRNA synthetase